MAQSYSPGPQAAQGMEAPSAAQPSASAAAAATVTAVGDEPVDEDMAEAAAAGSPARGRLDPLRMRRRQGQPIPQVTAPRAPRRYPNAEGGTEPRPLPRVYPERRIVDFWYIPAALIVAAIVAVGVIIGVDQFTGHSSNNPKPPTLAANSNSTVHAAGSATVASATTPTVVSTNTTPVPGGPFSIGEKLVVANTGDGGGGCLNVRNNPATLGSIIIVCLKDGSPVTVTGGPTAADNYTWWKVSSGQTEGWAVSQYLAPAG